MDIHAPSPFDTEMPVHHDAKGETVLVFLTKRDGKLRNYRCNNCSKLVFQYEGVVTATFEGSDRPVGAGSSLHECHRCGMKYRLVW